MTFSLSGRIMDVRLYFSAKALAGILSAGLLSSATMVASLRFKAFRFTIFRFITSKSLELICPVTLRLRTLLTCLPLEAMTASMVPGVVTFTITYSLASPSWELRSFSQSEMLSSASSNS